MDDARASTAVIMMADKMAKNANVKPASRMMVSFHPAALRSQQPQGNTQAQGCNAHRDHAHQQRVARPPAAATPRLRAKGRCPASAGRWRLQLGRAIYPVGDQGVQTSDAPLRPATPPAGRPVTAAGARKYWRSQWGVTTGMDEEVVASMACWTAFGVAPAPEPVRPEVSATVKLCPSQGHRWRPGDAA